MTFRCVTGISYDKNPFNDSSAQWVSTASSSENKIFDSQIDVTQSPQETCSIKEEFRLLLTGDIVGSRQNKEGEKKNSKHTSRLTCNSLIISLVVITRVKVEDGKNCRRCKFVSRENLNSVGDKFDLYVNFST